jgi:hypothetical protein
MTGEMSTPMRQVLGAMQRGASIEYTGWQQVCVYFPMTPERFTARQQTIYALRDRGLITLGPKGVMLTDIGRDA